MDKIKAFLDKHDVARLGAARVEVSSKSEIERGREITSR